MARAPHWGHASYLTSGCTRGLSHPWVPSHIGGIAWNQIVLCFPRLHLAEVCGLHKTGPSRPVGKGNVFVSEDAVCRSLEHIFCVSCREEPLSTSLLLAFVRDCRNPVSGSDLTASCAGKWTHTQRAPCLSDFAMWKWILWDCPFCYPYTAELDLLDSVYKLENSSAHVLKVWCIQNLRGLIAHMLCIAHSHFLSRVSEKKI